jgi:hypothetical protein
MNPLAGACQCNFTVGLLKLELQESGVGDPSTRTRTQVKMLREIPDDSIDSDVPSGASTSAKWGVHILHIKF